MEREKQTHRQELTRKEAELRSKETEFQQQLRQKVFYNIRRNRNPGYIFPQEEQLHTSEREKQSAQQQLTRKVNVLLSLH